MLEKVTQWRAVWTRFIASPWYRVIQIATVGLSIGLMLRALMASLSQIDLANYVFDPAAFFISLLLTWIAFYLGTFAWGEVVRALHPELPYLRAIEHHLLSVSIKYLPGVGWQQVSKMTQLHYLSDVPTNWTVFTVILELGLIVLTGLTVALQISTLTPRIMLGLSPELQSGIALVLWTLCIVLPPAVLNLVGRQIGKGVDPKRFMFHLYLAELLDAIGWLTFGLALWFVIRAIDPLPLHALPYCVTTLILSVVTGLIVVIVPNGYGVRELTMSTLLQTILPIPSSIIVALASRIILVAAEFLGVLPVIWLIGRRATRA